MSRAETDRKWAAIRAAREAQELAAVPAREAQRQAFIAALVGRVLPTCPVAVKEAFARWLQELSPTRLAPDAPAAFASETGRVCRWGHPQKRACAVALGATENDLRYLGHAVDPEDVDYSGGLEGLHGD